VSKKWGLSHIEDLEFKTIKENFKDNSSIKKKNSLLKISLLTKRKKQIEQIAFLSRIDILLGVCMYTYIHTYTHKTFFYAIRKFYFDKKKASNNITQNGGITCCSYVAIAACNKQLPARLATLMAGRLHLVGLTTIFNS